MAPVVEVDGLRKSYGSFSAVEDVSFQVAEGEIFGILGPNGSGKTTTVECVQGLRTPDGGRIRVLGLDPRADEAELRRHIGSQLQSSALPDRMKVWEALDLFAALAPDTPDWRPLAEQWGLTDKNGATFASLSGGQRQRLFVALALVGTPTVVFLDELTQGLDPAARRVAWDLIRRVRDRGATVVLVTHYMDEAERLCDRLAVVHRGRVIATGTPGELTARSARGSRVHFTCADSDLGWLHGVDGVDTVKRHGPQVRVEGQGPLLVRVAAALDGHGHAPEDLRVETATLEDVFFELTEGTEHASVPETRLA